MAAPTPQQHALLQQVRDLIVAETDAREVSMFGGSMIMVNNKMIVSVSKDGSLLVRVDANNHESLLNQPGESEIGAGRTMGSSGSLFAPTHSTMITASSSGATPP